MKSTIPIIETFLSLQGEGPSTGQPAFFLRLAHCNLSCSWCDTKHSWDWEKFKRSEEVENVESDVLLARLAKEIPPQVGLLVLTGGEPLLHQKSLTCLLSALREARPSVRVEVETNGTIAPVRDFANLVHLFVVSPKLSNAGVPEKRRINPGALAQLSELASIAKFVVEKPVDIGEAVEIATTHGFTPARVWVMPQTTLTEEIGPLIASIAPAAIAAGVRVSSRLHVMAWGDTRGT